MFATLVAPVLTSLLPSLAPEDGSSVPDVEHAEWRLGFRLPRSLRDFYLLLGNQADVQRSHNRFVGLDSLSIDNGVLVFLEENQAAYFWGVKAEDLARINPPVFQGNTSETEWYVEPVGLDLFLVNAVCWQILHSYPELARCRVSGAPLRHISGALRGVAGPEDAKQGDMHSYFDSGVVVCVFPEQGVLYVATRERSALHSFGKRFGLKLECL